MPEDKCYSCPYAQWLSEEDSTEPELRCDPPMGECPLDRPQDEYPEDLPDILSYENTGIERF